MVGHTKQTHTSKPELVALLRREGMTVEIKSYEAKDITKAFLEKLTDFNQLCFPPCTREACRADFSERSDIVYVATNKATGEIVGIAGEKIEMNVGNQYTYLSVAGVADSERGKELYPELVYIRIVNSLSNGIATIKVNTQNAKVEHGLRRTLDRLIEDGHLDSYSIERILKKGDYEEYGGRPAGNASLKSSSEEINKAYENLDDVDSFELVITTKKKIRDQHPK